MKIFQTALAVTLALTTILVACDKEVTTYLDVDRSSTLKANLKIIHASAYTINYPAALKVNDIRMSGVINNATPFPGGGLNTGGSNTPWYLSLDPGNAQIDLVATRAVTFADSVLLYRGTAFIEASKFYSAYITDTGANTQLVVLNEDPTPPVTDVTRFRFVNIMPNVSAIDLYFGANKVASNVLYTTSSPDFTLNRGDTAHWFIRTAGAAPTAAPIASYPSTAAPFFVPNKRVMSVFARGYRTLTGNRAPAISFLYN